MATCPAPPVPAAPLPSALPLLESARLRLRPYREDDAPAIFALYGDARVTRYWSHAAYTDIAQAHAYLRERMALETPAVYAWAIADKTSDALIGTTALFSLSGPHRRAEIGYSLQHDHQGKGLAIEALRTVIGHAFESLNLERIEADVDPRNEASWRLLEKLGFHREGLLRARWRANDEVSDSYFYGLLKAEQDAA